MSRRAFMTKHGTPAQFCPKSTTSVSPGATASVSPGLNVRVFTTLPKTFSRPVLSFAPATPFQQYASTGLSARSHRRQTSPPSEGRISPVNSSLATAAANAGEPNAGHAARASYSSPSKMAACLTLPATPAFQVSGDVP